MKVAMASPFLESRISGSLPTLPINISLFSEPITVCLSYPAGCCPALSCEVLASRNKSTTDSAVCPPRPPSHGLQAEATPQYSHHSADWRGNCVPVSITEICCRKVRRNHMISSALRVVRCTHARYADRFVGGMVPELASHVERCGFTSR